MPNKAKKTIRIKWTHSGIGFNDSQSEVVRALGLRRLNQVVERADTPQVLGLVAKAAHLVEVVAAVPEPLWSCTPEYTIKGAPSASTHESGPIDTEPGSSENEQLKG